MALTRNEQIQQLIEMDQRPMLSFELLAAKQALQACIETQRKLGEEMSSAMSESAETFHDNAPAEAIASYSAVNTSSAKRIAKQLEGAHEFAMPSEEEAATVTLGSVVGIRFGNDAVVDKFLVTGAATQLPDAMKDDTDIEVITLRSPLGEAIFDKRVGESASYTAGKRTVSITVDSLS